MNGEPADLNFLLAHSANNKLTSAVQSGAKSGFNEAPSVLGGAPGPV